MHILDILQNSVRAKASEIRLEIDEDTVQDTWTMRVNDNGTGMSGEELAKAPDAFFTTRTTRPFGLGLPLLKQNAERTGGWFRLESREGFGTRVTATFGLSHPDRPVRGDIPGVILLTASANPSLTIEYLHRRNESQFGLSTQEVFEACGGFPLSHPAVYGPLRVMMAENLRHIGIELDS